MRTRAEIEATTDAVLAELRGPLLEGALELESKPRAVGLTPAQLSVGHASILLNLCCIGLRASGVSRVAIRELVESGFRDAG